MAGGNDSAEYAAFAPSADLTAFVVRHMAGWSDTDQRHELRIPPTGGLYLSYVFGAPLRVHFSDRSVDHRSRMFIGGQLRREQPVLETRGRFGLLGVELTPSGFHRLFHRDASVYTDNLVDLAAECPGFAAAVEGRIRPDAPLERLIAAMESALRARVPGALATPLVDAVIARIVASDGVVRIRDLARAHGVSGAALRRRFVRVVGIPPKHYAKIVQVNAIVEALASGERARLQALALDHGYFDQAHFSHDFRRFVGANPTAFLAGGSSFLRTFLGRAAR